jgi:hypothetical protein
LLSQLRKAFETHLKEVKEANITALVKKMYENICREPVSTPWLVNAVLARRRNLLLNTIKETRVLIYDPTAIKIRPKRNKIKLGNNFKP